MTDPVLILDRDGVINEDSPDYIKSVDEWHPIPGSIDAIVRLSHAGYRIAVASNQSGLARGLFTLTELNAMHRQLRDLLAAQGGRIEMIAFCPHGSEAHCHCRKPQPGMLEEIADRLKIDLTGVPFVGDSISDVAAARVVGAAPWLVLTGKGRQTVADALGNPSPSALEDVPIYPNLGAVADAILQTHY